jgi:hypothetical protein
VAVRAARGKEIAPMHPARLDIQRRLRVIVPVGILIGLTVIAAMWARYFMIASNDNAVPGVWSRPVVWLTLAIFATVVAPPVLFLAVRNYIWLIRHGVEVPGRVTSIGTVTQGGATPIGYAYTVGGVEHTMKRDTPNAMSEGYTVGTPVLLLVNPRKPGHAVVLHVGK